LSDPSKDTPLSPEGQKEYVREELEQDEITHRGAKREANDAPDNHAAHNEQSQASRHLGAVDDEVVPVVPPMSGPADLVGEQNENAQGNENGKSDDEELFDPYDHITPG
jgi:hypothetical protein